MRRRISVLIVAACCRLAAADEAAGVPPATRALYDRFLKNYVNPNSSDPRLVTDLAAAPGGDLCFLDCAIARAHQGDYPLIASRRQLGLLDTQRTYDRLIGMLGSQSADDRHIALDLLGAWHRPEAAAKLLDRLDHGDGLERSEAIESLSSYSDPRIDPAVFRFIDDPAVSTIARSVLARRQYGPAFDKIAAALQRATPEDRDAAIDDVAAYRRPQAVEILLAQLQALEKDHDAMLVSIVDVRLREMLGDTFAALGESPDAHFDQWTDFWTRARPLLDDGLRLKHSPEAEPVFKPEQYAADLDRVAFAAALDAPTYRPGDPIRLRLALSNSGDKPVSTILPNVPSGWWPTMAYGIRLRRGDTVLLDLPASPFYQGSYSGPPPFETLAPGREFHDAVCLQYWLGPLVAEPMPPGDYELTIVFDSGQYAFIAARGIERLHRWTSPPVRFTVKGEPRRDADDILKNISAVTGRRFLLSDLNSQDSTRRDAAMRLIAEYGDTRLSGHLPPGGPFVESLRQFQQVGPAPTSRPSP